jgi:hypothetical protein
LSIFWAVPGASASFWSEGLFIVRAAFWMCILFWGVGLLFQIIELF